MYFSLHLKKTESCNFASGPGVQVNQQHKCSQLGKLKGGNFLAYSTGWNMHKSELLQGNIAQYGKIKEHDFNISRKHEKIL